MAWAVALAFALVPTYQSSSGGSATFVEVNGTWVLALLALPLLLTGAGLAAAREIAPRNARATLPVVAVILLLVVAAQFFYLIHSNVVPAVLALISAAGFLVTRRLDRGTPRATLWVATATMFLFCAMGIWSIGLLYLPSMLAMLFAAVMASTAHSGAGSGITQAEA
ncbi:MAG: hypothetical protein WD333_13895 [Dehalococcoidia bacterium]